MTHRADDLATFAYACQRGTEDALVLDALERIYAVADAADDDGRRAAFDFLQGFHAGVLQIVGAEISEDVRQTFAVGQETLWHAMILYEAAPGPATDQAIQMAETFCLEQFGVICDIRAGTAELPAQPDQHVRDWGAHVREQDAYWTARLRGEGEPLTMNPVAVAAVLNALKGPLHGS
ncbi:hypothetical protein PAPPERLAPAPP_02110 [Brevundimonas phage vB_BpoS-Papperlapapp]|nr:hypothetical protein PAPPERLAPAPP_02110 [Brevundimonas phage vB_BpoS-Papperlapapp]